MNQIDDTIAANFWWHDCATDDALSAFHAAAADLFVAAPWQHVPSTRCRLFVRPELDGPFMHAHLLCVSGQHGRERGFHVFGDVVSHLTWLEDRDTGEISSLPRYGYMALEFVSGTEIGEDVRRKAETDGWHVPDNDIWPIARTVGWNGQSEPVHLDDLAMFEAMARTLCGVAADPSPWQKAWRTDAAHEARLVIETSIDGRFDQTISTATPDWMRLFEGSDDELLAAFEQLDWSEGAGSVDAERLAELERSLIYRMQRSEPALLPPEQHAGLGLMLDVCETWCGIPLTALSPSELETIVFEAMPQMVAVPPSAARKMLDILRGTLVWLTERRAFEHIDACLALLDADATRDRLALALGDRKQFNEEKRIFMDGLDAGFDMNDPEEYDAYYSKLRLDTFSARSESFDNEIPNRLVSLTPVQKKKRKSSRKAARKARKKNR